MRDPSTLMPAIDRCGRSSLFLRCRPTRLDFAYQTRRQSSIALGSRSPTSFMRFSVSTFRRLLALSALTLAAALAAAQTITQAPIWASKPDAAGFEKMVSDHLSNADASIAKVTAVKGARTIQNTLVPFDEAVRNINSAAYLSGLMAQVHPETAFRDDAEKMVQKASAAQTALALNREVYQALSALDVSKADPATRYYVQRQLLEFRLAGVDKDEATREQLKKLNEQLTK